MDPRGSLSEGSVDRSRDVDCTAIWSYWYWVLLVFSLNGIRSYWYRVLLVSYGVHYDSRPPTGDAASLTVLVGIGSYW